MNIKQIHQSLEDNLFAVAIIRKSSSYRNAHVLTFLLNSQNDQFSFFSFIISDSPKFVCEEKQIVKRDATSAVIRCKVHFNPTPTAAHWEFAVSGNTYILGFNETSGDFKAEQWVGFLQLGSFQNINTCYLKVLQIHYVRAVLNSFWGEIFGCPHIHQAVID